MEKLSLLKVFIFVLALYRVQGIQERQTNPCLHGSYTCSCEAGWIGNNCDTAACGDWDKIGNSCYKVISGGKNFDAAKDACAAAGGNVVTIESSEESDGVNSYATQKGLPDYWLGITDAATEGTWVNANNGAALEYTNWAAGEPNNGAGRYEEECAVGMWRSTVGWFDAGCGWSHNVICEKSMPTA